MDPALQELIAEGMPDDDVAIIVRLHPRAEPPNSLHVVARFGTIATARTRRGELSAIHADPAIASLKAPRTYTAELEEVADEADVLSVGSDMRRPAGLAETGRGVIIAVIDWGCDFSHPDFREDDGSTRLIALWDQRETSDGNAYGYGRVHERATINRALGAEDPLAALGYALPPQPAHGTHVLGIAAGNGRAGGPQGLAPNAELLFCHLGSGAVDLGSSIELLEALHFVVERAAGRPLVINMSVGRHAGPHDGSLLIERAIDWLVTERPGVAIAQSTGNYFARDCHMSGHLRESERDVLPFTVRRRSQTPVSVETWYPSTDLFAVEVLGPDGIAAQAPKGGKTPVRDAEGHSLGMLYHRASDPNNGDNLINLVLHPEAPIGTWQVILEGIDVADGRWHSWVERDAACPACQARFRHDVADPACTTGSICNAGRTIAVGAHDAHRRAPELGAFSSVGPTRDGRVKPLMTAPGVKVLSCRSRRTPGDRPGYIRMSGTSMAAPHVAGTLALMFEAAGPQRFALLRHALFGTLDPAEVVDARWGYGRLAVERAVAAARALPHPQSTTRAPPGRDRSADPPARRPSTARESPAAMTNDPLLLPTADRQAGAAILTRAQDPDDPGMTVIGRSGRRLTTQLQPGDIILSGQGSRLAIVSDPRLLQRQAAAAEGLLTEGPWPGQYARVCGADGQPSPFARRVVGSDGLVLPEVWVLRPVELDEAAFDEAFEGRLAVLEDEQALDLERPLRQRTPAGGPPPAAPAATIEVVIDHDNDHVVDAASPVATAVMFGLWDRAFDAAGDLRNGAAEADNFVGSDARRFYLRVRDTSASGSTVVARWKTVTAAGANVDAPDSLDIMLTETAPGSHVYVSRALMLVSDQIDANVRTHSGIASGPGSGMRRRGWRNHRLRRATLDSLVLASYRPARGAVVSVRLPVFERSPEARLRLDVRVLIGRGRIGRSVRAHATPAQVRDHFAHANLRWAQAGLRIIPGAPVVRDLPAAVLDAHGRYTGVGGTAEEAVLLNDLLPVLPDTTVTVLFARCANGANAYTTLFRRDDPRLGPPASTPNGAMGERYLVVIDPRTRLTEETLAHEFHHVLFNRSDDAVDRQFFSFNTQPPSAIVRGTRPRITLPDHRIYRRIHTLHAADPNNDPAADCVINWVRRQRITRFPLASALAAPDASTGNILTRSFS